MRQEYLDVISEMANLSPDIELEVNGMSDRAVVGLMIVKRLDRIADLMEKALMAQDMEEA